MGRVSSNKCRCPMEYKQTGKNNYSQKPWRNCKHSLVCGNCGIHFCKYYETNEVHCTLQKDAEKFKQYGSPTKTSIYEEKQKAYFKTKPSKGIYYEEKSLVVSYNPPQNSKEKGKAYMKLCTAAFNAPHKTDMERADAKLKNNIKSAQNCKELNDFFEKIDLKKFPFQL